MTSEKNQSDNRIHVAVGFDKNFVRPFYALMRSLIEHHTPGQIVVHAVCEDVPEQEVRRIADWVSLSGNNVTFYAPDPSRVAGFVTGSKWTSVVYYRLFFPFWVPDNVQRLLYLDCDMTVVNSLWPLYNHDLAGHPLGAVYDNFVKTQPQLDIVEEGEYFNSGMLLIDLPQWRREKISEKALDFLSAHPGKIQFVDQCALNAVLHKRWKKLDSRFNRLYSFLPEGISKRALDVILKDTVVIHYTLQRPWQMLCKNRFRNLYFHYLKRAGVRNAHSYSDFAIKKIPAWVKIRLYEFYHDHPGLQAVWRSIHAR